MPLLGTLEASFGAGGFDLQLSATGLRAVLEGIAPAGAVFDAARAGEITALLEGVDLGRIESAVAAAVDLLTGTTSGIPDGEAVLAPLRAALRFVDLIGGGGLGSLTAGATAGRGIDGVLPTIAGVLARSADPAVRPVLDLLHLAVPGADLAAVAATVGPLGADLAAVVRLVGGLLAVESTTRDLLAGIELTASFLEPGRIVADRARLEAWAGTGALADLLVGIDPDDAGIIEVVAGPLLDYATTVRRFGDVVVRGMAWGEATLAGLDVPAVALQLDATSALLDPAQLDGVRRLSAEVRARLDVVLRIDLPTTPAATDLATGLAAAAAALGAALDQVDPTALAAPLGALLREVTAPLEAVEVAAHEVVAVARSALAAVGAAVAVVDLRPVADAIRTAVEPASVALDALTDLVAEGAVAVEAAAGAVQGVLTPARDALAAVAGALDAAVTSVAADVELLDLDLLEPQLRAGADQVAAALQAAQLRPVFDVVVGGLDTAADALATIPRDLLPDDLRAALDEACGALHAIDLEPVRVALTAELAAIVDGVDTGVLDAVRAAHGQVLGFLDAVDPRPPLLALEDGPFADLVGRLRLVDPSAALGPVLDAVDGARAAIAAFDPAALLAPLEDALDDIVAAVHGLDPTVLLAPVEAALAAARQAVVDTLGLDDRASHVDRAEAAVQGALQRISLVPVVAALDVAHAELVATAAAPADGPGPLATVVAALVEGTGVRVRADAFDEVGTWLSGATSGSAVVAGRIDAALASVEALAAAVRDVDVRGLVGRLTASHQRIEAALHLHPEGSGLRVRLDGELRLASPGDLLGPVLLNRDRYLELLDGAARALRAMAAASRAAVDTLTAGLRVASAPLLDVPAEVRALVTATTGVDGDGRPLRDVLAEVLGLVQPSVVLAPVAEALERLRDRAADAAVEAVFVPVRAASTTVQATLGALDISFVRTELDAARDALVADLEALRPSVLLGDVLAAADDLRNRIADLDPLAPVRAVVDGLRATIDDFAAAFRPTVLAGDALDAFDGTRAAVDSLAIDEVLRPVLDALDAITTQLDEGMGAVVVALRRVQDACASGGPSIGLAVTAAVDISGGFSL